MPIAPSFQDLLTVGQAEAQIRRGDLTFFDGDITVAQLHACAAMGDSVIRFLVQAFAATFLDTAEGDDLTVLVDDHWDIQRQLATAAQVTISITRPFDAGAEPAGSIPAGTTVATEFDQDGEQVSFTTDDAVAWALGELGPKTVVATAINTGPTGNVAASTVVRLIDVPAFDDTFVVTNPAVAGGGNVEETDEELRARARNRSATLRRGTLAALETGALEVDEIRSAIALEAPVTFNVTVRVTDGDGNSTAQMVQDAITELENWRCAGVPISVVGGTQLPVTMAISLVVRVGFDVTAAAADLVAAVENRMSKLKSGETMFLDSIIGAIIAVAPDDILDVIFDAISVPAGALPIADVVPLSSEVIRAGTITVTEA